ncbi:MAG TPA: hypothetical protein DCQ31_14750, partial [Bacteroidales bacterium]|nr:hypothetical protein [Bacteroidales bacterium]
MIEGNADIEDANNANSIIKNISEGINTLTWTLVSDICGESTDTLTLLKNPKAYAGKSQSICTDTITLHANQAYFGTGTWKTMKGLAKFDDKNNPNTNAQILRNNTVLRWEIDDNCKKTSAEIQITLINPEKVFAGDDQQICSEQTTLKAQSGNNLPGTWTDETLDGTAIFDSPNNKQTVVSFLKPGINVFSYHTTNKCGTTFDEVQILNAIEQPAMAGEDIISCTEIITLKAAKPLSAKGFWTINSGNATFENS